METVYANIMDVVDVETYFICQTEQQGKNMMIALLKTMGFNDVDVVFIQHLGFGARVRGRAYIHRPADKYEWLDIGG